MSGPDARRRVELRVLPALIAFGVVLPIPLAGELPDPIATHWDAAGDPNGCMPRVAYWLGAILVWLALWALLERRSRQEPARRGGRMPEAIALLAAGGLLAGTTIAIAVANHGAADCSDADVAGLVLLVPILAGALLAGAAGWWCERGRWFAPRAAAGGGEPLTVALGRGEQAMWVGGARSGPMLCAGIAIGVAAVASTLVAGAPDGWPFLAGLAVTAIALLWACAVRVTVTAAGVRVALGPLGRPTRFLALDEIAHATAIDVEPLRWGGWGYRWLGRGRIAVVVRRGPGLLMHRRDGGSLAVTVDRAEEAAGLLNDLIARRT